MLSLERNQELEISKGNMSLSENSRKNLVNSNSLTLTYTVGENYCVL